MKQSYFHWILKRGCKDRKKREKVILTRKKVFPIQGNFNANFEYRSFHTKHPPISGQNLEFGFSRDQHPPLF